MDLRLVDYVAYLAVSMPLTVWVGRALHRAGAPYLTDVLGSAELAGSLGRLLEVGFLLVGLGGVALLLQVDGAVASAADVVRSVATRLGLVLLLLGGLHGADVLALHRLRRRGRGGDAAAPAPAGPALRAAGRWPY